MYCTVYGYGFVFDKEELQLELVMDFILHHAKVFQRTDEETQLVELMRELKGQQAAGEDISEDLEAEMEDMELYYQDDSSRQHGIGAVIATIMRRETGLRFQYWPDCEEYSTEPAVLWKTTNKPITDTAGGDETKKTKRRPFTQAERMQVYTRDRGICGICGAFVPPDELTIDHVIPISKGGTYELNNLQCCCRRCNLLKADALPEEFLDLVASIAKYQITEKTNRKMRKNLKKALKKSKKEKPKKKKKSKK